MRYYLSFIIFFVGSALFAQDPVKNLVDKLAGSYLENGNGALVIGVKANGVSRIYYYGKKAIDKNVLPDSSDIFEIGGITETFTNIVLADKAIKGEVSIDGRLQDYLDENVPAVVYQPFICKPVDLVDPSTIKWSQYSEKYFPFHLRQRDGAENTLGVLKFMFSNPYAIYLHDTNSRTLFSKENRWLSHGCIRLDKAKNFAQLLCETSTYNFNTDSLNRYMLIKSRIKVAIYPEIPIHIRYYSIEADSNNVNFYPDVYQIDSKMHQALQNN